MYRLGERTPGVMLLGLLTCVILLSSRVMDLTEQHQEAVAENAELVAELDEWRTYNSAAAEEIARLRIQVDELFADVADYRIREDTQLERVHWGSNFQITGYCPCEECCPGYGTNRPYAAGRMLVKTATSTFAEEGLTCAVDPDVIPLGSVLLIEGVGIRIAQDTGVEGLAVDIYCRNHEDTYTYTASGRSVWVLHYAGKE